MLTPDIVRELRKPFAPEQIKWKVQTNPREGDEYAVVVAYLDARDITERLDLATGGDWWNDYAIPQVKAGSHAVLECRLTVCGVTRCDVGSVPIPDRDDATKDLYSDAMKRAAVQFGIASHIYRFPSVKAKVEKFGKSFYLTRRAKEELLLLNKCLIAGQQPPRYTDIKVSGDAWGAGGNTELFEEPKQEASAQQAARPAAAQPATNGAALISDAQRKMLFAIWKEGGWEGELQAWVLDNYKCELPALSKKDASAAIELLQKEIKVPA